MTKGAQFAYQKSYGAPLFVGEPANSLFGVASANLKTALIGATYDFGVAKAHVAYADNKLKFGNVSTKMRDYLIGISAPLGATGTVLTSYTRNDLRDLDNGKSDMYSLGYTYALSKRTNLYTSYSYTKNDDYVALNTAGGHAAGQGVSFFNVGIRHTF